MAVNRSAEILPDGIGVCGRRVSVAPWSNWDRITWVVDGCKGKNVAENKCMGLVRLNACENVDVWVYTDGSAGGMQNGGAGVAVTRGSADMPVLVECLEVPAGCMRWSLGWNG